MPSLGIHLLPEAGQMRSRGEGSHTWQRKTLNKSLSLVSQTRGGLKARAVPRPLWAGSPPLPCPVSCAGGAGPSPHSSPSMSRSGCPGGSQCLCAPSPHRVFPVNYRHSEVSPLTMEDPKDARESPCEPDATPASSDLLAEQACGPQPGPSAPASRPESQGSGFDFNGPYLGLPHSHSLPDVLGQPAPPQAGVSQKPQPPGALEYLCLPAGGRVQLVPLAQVMAQGQAKDLDRTPGPEAEGSPSLESGAGLAPSAPGLMVGGQGAKNSPSAKDVVLTARPPGSGGPEGGFLASGYVTTTDLALPLPTELPSVSTVHPGHLPSDQNQSLSLGGAGGPHAAPAPGPACTCGLSRGRSSSWEAPPMVFHRSLTIFRQDWRGRPARRAAAERKDAEVGAGFFCPM